MSRYVPRSLSKKDKTKQILNLHRSQIAYTKRNYINRPILKSFKTKPSSHVSRAKALFGVQSMAPTAELAKASGCSQWALEKIIQKGEGAYYSSGSRPNQTPQSWGYARLASALTGGPASKVDALILKQGCKVTRK